MHVFDDTQPNEIRIVIATNAAESSITLPDVDSVICLGLCKVSVIVLTRTALVPNIPRLSILFTIKLPTGSY